MAHLLLFDLMDTVVIDPFFPAIRSLLDEEGIKQWASLRRPGIFEAFEKGEISESQYFRDFYRDGDLPDHMPSVAKIKKRMFGSVRFRPGMKELLDDLLQRHDLILAIASNYSAWYHEVFRRRPELNRFSYLFFSCEMGVRKPDADFFDIIERSVLDSLSPDVTLDSIWFFDDRPANLEPARERGWRAHLVGIRSSDPRDSAAIQDEVVQPLRQAGII
ncbi:MAG: hypothetical protein CMN76_00675 [Spirochaetaceae bacterium]|nr:hypothetical protein [Spirochaetaceae bacterium]|tara:strand:+ start:8252 stop:8905 length:654 start_codon:yes stop_codon:yes gene_type:complete